MIKPKIKVIISNMAWIDKSTISPVDLFQIKKPLYVMPKAMNNDGDQSIEMFRETPTHIGIPRVYFRMYFDVHDETYDISYDLCAGRRLPFNEKKITLRSVDQEPFVAEMVQSLTVGNWGCGIGEAYTGFGKSVVGIKIAESLSLNTLILVHNEEIKNVWQQALKVFYPNASVGLIQGAICDYKKDFVIAMCQSLMTDEGKYPQEIYKTFGLVFVDEVHRFGARSFGNVAPRFNCKYIFGLTGTDRRKDDAEEVYHWVIGDVILKADETNRIKPIIYFRDTKIQMPSENVTFTNVKGEKVTRRKVISIGDWSRPDLLKYICSDKNRLKLIALDILHALKDHRHPLVVAERKEPLYEISKLVKAMVKGDPFFQKTVSHGFYFGSTDDKANARLRLDAAGRCTIVYATLQKAKEGVDIVRLDTLFLVTPNTDTEQVIGRICRPTLKMIEGEPVNQPRVQPFVFDYVDCALSPCRSAFQQRHDLYKQRKWATMDLHTLDLRD